MKPRAFLILGVLVILGLVLFSSFEKSPEPLGSSPTPAEGPVTDSASRAEVALTRGPRDFRPRAVSTATAEDEAPGSLSGRVLDASTGDPVGGAELVFQHQGGAITEVTGADGAFLLETESVGAYRLAALSADGYLPYAPHWGESPVVFVSRAGAALSDVELFLQPEELLTVRVINEEGQPVPGATVTVRPRTANPSKWNIPPYTTDNQGQVELAAPDWSILRARDDAGRDGRAMIGPKAQASGSLSITIRPATGELGTIGGVVLLPDGSPASEAAVWLDGGVQGRGDLLTRSDPEGRFRLRGLEPAPYQVEAELRGYAPTVAEGVRPGTTDLELILGAGAVLSGRVLTEDGDPIPAFKVWLGRRLGPIAVSPVGAEAFFDPEGRFEFRGVRPGVYQVVANAFGYAASSLATVEIPEDGAEVELKLGTGGAIRGIVVDAETDVGIAGAEIQLEGSLDDGPSVAGALLQTVTGADGSFELPNVSAGNRGFRAGADGYHSQLVRGVAVPQGSVIALEPVRLEAVGPDEEQSLDIVGIGATLGPQDDALVIAGAVPGSGAENAGLQPGDGILAVDGTPVVDLGFEGAIQRMAGPVDSQVTLRIRRGDAEPFDVQVTRTRLRL